MVEKNQKIFELISVVECFTNASPGRIAAIYLYMYFTKLKRLTQNAEKLA